MSLRHIAVVGAGYAGTIQAIELLRRGLAVTLIERRLRPARGAAYGTEAPDHLLNVRAGGMSAFAGAPDHFADWLAAHGEGTGTDFAPRRTYGRYLAALLDQAKLDFGERLCVLHDEAVDLAAPTILRLASGTTLRADAVILALGNLPPDVPRAIPADLPTDIYVADPWSAELAAGLRPDDRVLLIGTGLTAIDAALSLDSAGFPGPILALSRRGLLPRAHADVPLVPPSPATRLPAHCSALLRSVRLDAERVGWREAVDALRPVTQPLWANADRGQRRRFLRHLRPWWDVHRHRIAPSIARRIAGLREAGQLSVAAGKLAGVAPGADGSATVTWRPRGRRVEETLPVRRIVNCTGPQTDIVTAGEPLLDALLAARRIRPDPDRIGIDVDADCRVRDADGASSSELFAIGPNTRGAFWEIVAVPDIRRQIEAVADLAAADRNGCSAPF